MKSLNSSGRSPAEPQRFGTDWERMRLRVGLSRYGWAGGSWEACGSPSWCQSTRRVRRESVPSKAQRPDRNESLWKMRSGVCFTIGMMARQNHGT